MLEATNSSQPFNGPSTLHPSTQLVPKPTQLTTQLVPKPSQLTTQLVPKPTQLPTQLVPKPSQLTTQLVPKPTQLPTQDRKRTRLNSRHVAISYTTISHRDNR